MFKKLTNSNLKAKHLGKLMWLFFIAMALPTAVLIYKSYDQLKWEAFFQHRQLAEELSNRIDSKLNELINIENRRSFDDYQFLIPNDGDSNERSVLSTYPIESSFPGLIGYFQINAEGEFTTPLLPSLLSLRQNNSMSSDELQNRKAIEQTIQNILSSNRLVKKQNLDLAKDNSVDLDFSQRAERSDDSFTTAANSTESLVEYQSEKSMELADAIQPKLIQQSKSQAGFDKLSSENMALEETVAVSSKRKVSQRLKELELESPFKEKISKEQRRKKQIEAVKTKQKPTNIQIAREPQPKIEIFENEIDAFEISLLESNHFVLYRKVWRKGKRSIQGLLVERNEFLDGIFQTTYRNTLLSNMSSLSVIFQGEGLASYTSNNHSALDLRSLRRNTAQLDGTLLYNRAMSAPFEQFESVYTIRHLPAGTGSTIILWTAFILTLVLSIGTYLLYRMSLKNLALVSQQQDFISAVSHELRTPLTSIRMYGEILKEGWASDEKKASYYSYIFDESERLTRLINNVLELARMTRNETKLNLDKVSIGKLVDIINSKVDSQIERSNFTLELSKNEQLNDLKLNIDCDAFAQIIINLVDNALKFSVHADKKVIQIDVSQQKDNSVVFSVRDFGPGIKKDQLKKIFELFYRSESELTRETSGTGIGLALVNQLTKLMQGKIDVINHEVGAEFKLSFSPDR